MLNVKNIPIGSLIKIKTPQVGILKDTDPLINWLSFPKTVDLKDPVILLDYKEGVTEIYHETNKSFNIVYCSRILVIGAGKRFWIVINSANKDVENLPEDLKSSIRYTNKIDIILTKTD